MVFPFYFWRRITTDLEKGLTIGSQITRVSSWLHLRFWVSAQELEDTKAYWTSLFILELFLCRSILLNGMRKLKRAKFCWPGTLKFLASPIKQITWEWRLLIQLGYNSNTSFIHLAEISWRVFDTSFLEAHYFEYLVVSPMNFILTTEHSSIILKYCLDKTWKWWPGLYAQWLRVDPWTRRSQLIPSQSTCLGCGLNPP